MFRMTTDDIPSARARSAGERGRRGGLRALPASEKKIISVEFERIGPSP